MQTLADKNGQFLDWDDVVSYIGPQGRDNFYWRIRTQGERRGQAFYNVLSPEDRKIINGTSNDCFFKDDQYSIILALEAIISA